MQEDKATVGGAQRTGSLGMIGKGGWLKESSQFRSRRRATSSGYVGQEGEEGNRDINI